MPLEGDWQLPELARSVALPVLPLQQTVLRAALNRSVRQRRGTNRVHR